MPIFNNFKLAASPFLTDAYCKFGHSMIEVPNGFLSFCMFCPECEDVYTLKLVKANKKNVSEEYLKQCKEACERKNK